MTPVRNGDDGQNEYFEAVVDAGARMVDQHGWDGAIQRARRFMHAHGRGTSRRAFWHAVAESIEDVKPRGLGAPPECEVAFARLQTQARSGAPKRDIARALDEFGARCVRPRKGGSDDA
jgi:hypothetical protein